MSPESGQMHHRTILEEAERVKPELLKIEANKRAAGSEDYEIALAGFRKRNGYGEIDDFDSRDLSDKRVKLEPGISPKTLMKAFPITRNSAETTKSGRRSFEAIFNQETGKLAVFLGPCSVHDAEQLKEYAHFVNELRVKYGNDLEIYLRVYCEKPRTILKKGSEWKGWTYDPYLDGSDSVDTGVIATHLLTCQITDMGVPIVVERLNRSTVQYMDKRVSVDVIGARDSESQATREYGSGTSSGGILYKNSTDGDIKIAVDAAKSAGLSSSFIGMAADGHIAIARTQGNPYAGIILRGGKNRPNYYPRDVKKAKSLLEKEDLMPSIVADLSHGNSGKDANNQEKVARSICRQIALGETAIIGVMMESFFMYGKQNIGPLNTLEHGLSVTDECIDKEKTIVILDMFAKAVRKRRQLLIHKYPLDV